MGVDTHAPTVNAALLSDMIWQQYCRASHSTSRADMRHELVGVLAQIPAPGNCPAQFTPAPPNQVALVPPVMGGSFTFTCNATTTGISWLACPVPTHCPSKCAMIDLMPACASINLSSHELINNMQ